MADLHILTGAESFHELREGQCCYVDKTSFIEELLARHPAKVSLITRPRRFGKTLALTTLEAFLDIRKDSRALFDGLEIAGNLDICSKWMNKAPVLFLSLKSVEGDSFARAIGKLRRLFRHLCEDHAYLLQSDRVLASTKADIARILDETADEDDLADLLLTLCRALHMHHGRKAVLLVDEYDVPLSRAHSRGFYTEMVDFIRSLLGSALKSNFSLEFAVLTGCLRISKESIFTGLNNLECYGISDVPFADCFGFTQEEVERLLADAHFSHKMADIKEWYDGYRFGRKEGIYCPWDVLKYVKDLMDDPGILPGPYWENTSGNDIIRRFLDTGNMDIRTGIETLVNGGSIRARIAETLTWGDLFSSPANIWTVLYLTGYLTKAPQQAQDGGTTDNATIRLVIPNREIRSLYTKIITSWQDDRLDRIDRKDLLAALWSGDSRALTRLVCEILVASICCHDYHKNFYHGLVLGIFAGTDPDLASNRESGKGRPDILVNDPAGGRCAIIEIKQADTLAGLPRAVEEALAQIREKEYAAPLRLAGRSVRCWGIAFAGKDCLARCAEDADPGQTTRA